MTILSFSYPLFKSYSKSYPYSNIPSILPNIPLLSGNLVLEPKILLKIYFSPKLSISSYPSYTNPTKNAGVGSFISPKIYKLYL